MAAAVEEGDEDVAVDDCAAGQDDSLVCRNKVARRVGVRRIRPRINPRVEDKPALHADLEVGADPVIGVCARDRMHDNLT